MAGARIPASPVSEAMSAWQEYARHFRNLPPDGRVSEPQFPGCVASNDQFSSTSLCSRILNVRVVIKETRFESHVTGSTFFVDAYPGCRLTARVALDRPIWAKGPFSWRLTRQRGVVVIEPL